VQRGTCPNCQALIPVRAAIARAEGASLLPAPLGGSMESSAEACKAYQEGVTRRAGELAESQPRDGRMETWKRSTPYYTTERREEAR